MRKLKKDFLYEMRTGFLKGLTEKVRQDRDLDLQIRDKYLNVYYKGNSLLKLSQIDPLRYRVSIHQKFTQGMEFPVLIDQETTNDFLNKIPAIKENIIRHGKSSLEIEYEQMIIRANNYELRSNSEYYIVDRQYVAGKAGRFDLTGIYTCRAEDAAENRSFHLV